MSKMQRWIVRHYFLQMFAGVFIWWMLLPLRTIPAIPSGPFVMATFWPPSRMPVFLMGVLAGLLRIYDPGAFVPFFGGERATRDAEWCARACRTLRRRQSIAFHQTLGPEVYSGTDVTVVVLSVGLCNHRGFCVVAADSRIGVAAPARSHGNEAMDIVITSIRIIERGC